MMKLFEKLRFIPVKKRMLLFYIILCIVPVGILLCTLNISNYYQNQKKREDFDKMYNNQIIIQLNAIFQRFQQKLEYLANNNDLLADTYLYWNDKEYQNLQVRERIERVLNNAINDEEFFSYGMMISEEERGVAVGSSYPDMDSIKNKISSSRRKEINKVQWVTMGMENIFCYKQVYIGTEENTLSYYIVLGGKTKNLLKMLKSISLDEDHDLVLLDENYKEVMKIGKSSLNNQSYVEKNQLKNGWILKNEFGGEKVFIDVSISTVFIALLMLIIAGVNLYLFSESITEPLKKVTDKIEVVENMAEQQQFHKLSLELKETADGQDEHAILEREFDRMVLRQRELLKHMYVTKITEQELQTKIKELELNVMQQQINPHFLFNVLETIYWMAEEKGYEKIGEMISTLGDFFKLSVSGKKEYVIISEEIENAKSYVALLKILYGGRLRVEWNISKDVLQYNTIKLTLQPIIENAFEHGFANMETGGVIWISCNKEKDTIVFTIEDNGQGMTKKQLSDLTEYIDSKEYDSNKSVGVKNVNTRIKLYFGEKYGLQYSSTFGQGTIVKIIIPVVLEESEKDV